MCVGVHEGMTGNVCVLYMCQRERKKQGDAGRRTDSLFKYACAYICALTHTSFAFSSVACALHAQMRTHSYTQIYSPEVRLLAGACSLC